jgi:plastocyanin
MTLAPGIKRRSIAAVAVLAAVGALAAPVLAAEHAVSIVGSTFEPARSTVAVGDTVVWTVTESNGELHSVTSGKPGFVGQGGTSFDSGIVMRDNGATFSQEFGAAGVYDYFCQVHPVEMLGQVIVLEPGQSAPPVEPPASEVDTGIAPERRLLAGGILLVTLVLGFASAWLWRRMNPA